MIVVCIDGDSDVVQAIWNPKERKYSMENSVKNWANQLELVCKHHTHIKSYEIYIEASNTNRYLGQVDRRGRWNGEIQKLSHSLFQFHCSLYLQNHQYAKLRFRDKTSLTPEDVINKVLAKAATSEPDSSKGLPLRLEVNFCGQETWDSRYPRLTEEDRLDVIELNMESTRVVSPRAKAQAFRLRETESCRYYRSSNNIGSLDKSTFFNLSGEINIITSKVTETITPVLSSHRFADISSRPIAVDAIRRKDVKVKQISCPDGDILVMFSPKIVAGIVSLLPQAFTEENVSSKKSFVHEFMGEKVGTTKVHIIDDATVPSGINTRYFDARGVPPLPITLIREGVITSTYLSPEHAQKQDKRPSGHIAFDGNLWPGNLLVRAGRRSQNMILADKLEAILALDVTEPIQLNIQTGQIDITAIYDLVGSDGVKGRVGERKISCHVFDLFGCVIESANDQNRFDFVDACTWVLEGVKFKD
jgi:predicted Zn-dependent protease